MVLESRKVAALALTSVPFPGAGDCPLIAAPGSGSTIDICKILTLDDWVSRVDLSLISSHDSAANGLVIRTTFDKGASWEQVGAAGLTYTAATDLLKTYSIVRVGDGIWIAYTNSAAALTKWKGEVRLHGDRAYAASTT